MTAWTETASGVLVAKAAGAVWTVWIFEYLNIPQEQLTILAVLMVIDFFTGISKQYGKNPGEITSVRWWAWLRKKLSIHAVIFTVALVIKGLWLDGGHYVSAALSLAIITEAYSIVQNSYAIKTGKELPEFDAFALFMQKFSEYLKASSAAASAKEETPK